MNTYQPYTYLIGWSSLDLWYYGVRYAQNCHPDNFWKDYFTSSTHVKECRIKFGEPDVIQIRKVFATANQAVDWEAKVLKRLKVYGNERWLNQVAGFGGSTIMSDQTRAKISKALRGKAKSADHVEKMKAARASQIISDQHRKKTSETMRGRSLSDEHKKNLSRVNKGRKRSHDTLRKMSEAVTGKRWITNGIEERMSRDLPEGWYYGRLTKTQLA